MSNRNDRKARVVASQKAISNSHKVQELKDIKLQLENKLEKQKKDKIKKWHIRNLKIVKSTCKFLVPFVISTGITVGTVKLFGGGYPFHLDKIKKYKLYQLNYDTNGCIEMNEEYIKWGIFSTLDSNSLVVYSKWQEENGKYTRYKREYEIGNLKSKELLDAILNKDYSYIENKLTNFKEEIQITNQINEKQINDYIIEANLYILDKDDTLVYDELYLTNIITTFADIIFGLVVGGLISREKYYNYKYEIRMAINGYKYIIESVQETTEELEKTNQKILSLSKFGGEK